MKYKILFLIVISFMLVLSGCAGNKQQTVNKVHNQTYKVEVVKGDGSSFWIYYMLFMQGNGQYGYAMSTPKTSTGWSTLTKEEVTTIEENKGQITEEKYSEFTATGELVEVPPEVIDETNAEIPSTSDDNTINGGNAESDSTSSSDTVDTGDAAASSD
jgi:hypothetical protein